MKLVSRFQLQSYTFSRPSLQLKSRAVFSVFCYAKVEATITCRSAQGSCSMFQPANYPRFEQAISLAFSLQFSILFPPDTQHSWLLSTFGSLQTIFTAFHPLTYFLKFTFGKSWVSLNMIVLPSCFLAPFVYNSISPEFTIRGNDLSTTVLCSLTKKQDICRGQKML